jgi:N-acetylmuramoyl-L-alanine amidase
MQKSKSKGQKYKLCIVILIFVFCILNFSGCATVSPRKFSLSTYSVGGKSYLALVPLCELKAIDWDYDIFTRVITLRRDFKEIRLMPGSSLVSIDGSIRNLGAPVKIYKSVLLVPVAFKKILDDSLAFKSYPASVPISVKKIVLDAGHGGKDPGAISKSGLKEKHVTLSIARRLKKILQAKGFKVILTRDRDKFISLGQRTRIANQAQADLFISIHANANHSHNLSGLEVYYLSDKVNDFKRASVAARQARLNLNEAQISEPTLQLKSIIWDMIYLENRAQSIDLARCITKDLGRQLNMKVIGVKPARFYVLKNTNMPAILIEVGYLSNTSEAKMLKNRFYREQVARSLAEAIQDYCRLRYERRLSMR